MYHSLYHGGHLIRRHALQNSTVTTTFTQISPALCRLDPQNIRGAEENPLPAYPYCRTPTQGTIQVTVRSTSTGPPRGIVFTSLQNINALAIQRFRGTPRHLYIIITITKTGDGNPACPYG
ncbi:hypothetical protein BDD12DRAFT_830080 [Trichophaea hybrida]|nr:hypothetical protein BDD12DRAFT_830080 [Trichophaea hybrida]